MRFAEAVEEQTRKRGDVGRGRFAQVQRRIVGAVGGGLRQRQGVLGMVVGRAEARRQLAPGGRHARNDQQQPLTAAGVAERQRGLQQRPADAAPALLRIDHPGQLERGPAEAVDAEKAEQPVVLGPEQRSHVVRRGGAQRGPLQLQASTVTCKDASLEVFYRLERRILQAVCLLKHHGDRTHDDAGGGPASRRRGPEPAASGPAQRSGVVSASANRAVPSVTFACRPRARSSPASESTLLGPLCVCHLS